MRVGRQEKGGNNKGDLSEAAAWPRHQFSQQSYQLVTSEAPSRKFILSLSGKETPATRCVEMLSLHGTTALPFHVVLASHIKHDHMKHYLHHTV